MERIKAQLAQLDKENRWHELEREDVIDLLIYEEIKAASYEKDSEGLGKIVSILIKEGEKLK